MRSATSDFGVPRDATLYEEQTDIWHVDVPIQIFCTSAFDNLADVVA